MEEEKKQIVDATGNVLNKKKERKTFKFLSENVWNIIGVGLPALITLISGLNLIVSKKFTNSCAEYYGINREYFCENGIFEDKILVIVCAFILFLYPFIFSYFTKGEKNKFYVIIMAIMTIMILFVQNLIYTVSLLDIISNDCIRKIIDNYYLLVALLIVDIVIAYFMIIRGNFGNKKRFYLGEKIIFVLALVIYLSNVITGISINMSYQISDKKDYEVIEQNKAIVSIYDGKFVVMDCEIHDETIILKKGKYSFQEMTGVSITYHKYENAECE